MLLNVARFELKYQLRNPVFWVSLFLFFLLGFGVTASENVSIGTPGTVNENSPFAIASMMALTSLFYLFVITSFVANAVVRPILTILTFPLTILTFGLFLLVVNAAVIGLVAALLGGFVVDGLWAGIGAAIVTGFVSGVAGWFIGDERRRD